MSEKSHQDGKRGINPPLFSLNRALTDILDIEFVKMGVPAVMAAGGEMVAPDNEVMRSSHPAMLARRDRGEFPDIITANRGIGTLFRSVLNSGEKYPGGAAI
jgi:hypothetical protein